MFEESGEKSPASIVVPVKKWRPSVPSFHFLAPRRIGHSPLLRAFFRPITITRLFKRLPGKPLSDIIFLISPPDSSRKSLVASCRFVFHSRSAKMGGIRRGDRMVYDWVFLLVGGFGALYSVRLLLRHERREKWATYLFSSLLLFLWGLFSLSPARTGILKALNRTFLGSS